MDHNNLILIVEDDESLNKLIQKKLKQNGYSTFGVCTSKEAVEWTKVNHFSLILIDYILGNCNAITTIKEIENNLGRIVPFVIMTGNGDEKVAVEMMKMGALDYLIKDIAFIDLLPPIVKQVLEHIRISNELEKSQRELKESELRHRLLAESINDLIDKKNINGEFIYLSPQCYLLWGYSENELLNKSISDFIHPDDVTDFKYYQNNLYESDHKSIIKYRFLRKNGTYGWFETNTRVLSHPVSGKVIEFVSVTRDITEVMATESILREKEAAELANKAKSEFLANMSHEIRNPLNAILGISNNLMKMNLSEEQKKYINSIRISSNNLMNLINDILDFSKIEAKHVEIVNGDFDLNEVIEEITTMYENQSSDKNIKLLFQIDSNVETHLHGDSYKLRQIITNLLSNAIKFTDEGEIKIKISQTFKTKLAVNIRIEVSDTGIGIKKEDFGKIFNLFTQIDSSPSKKYQGTGLGLTIVKKLTELLSGSISFDSNYGKGSIFSVEIPFQYAKNKMPEYNALFNSQQPDAILENVKVLLAEDDGINQLYLKGFLRTYQCVVETAFNGEIAVEKFSNDSFDIILMDGQMPKMDGFEAAKRIRKIEKEKELPHTPIIAITGYAVKGDRERFLDAGMDDYITKPINETKLIEVIKKFCKK
ncbi:MAG: response regulator [Bacteroidales bacterium]|nr:response regulator [Bacteroidales bacterium]